MQLNYGYKWQLRVSPGIFTLRSKNKNGEFTDQFSPRLNLGVASEPRPSTIAISKRLGARNLFVDSLLALFYRNSVIVMLCEVILFVVHQCNTPPRGV